MNRFLDPLYTKDLEQSEYRVELVQPFRYEYNGEIITVRAGFWTDFASVPRVVQNIFPPTGPYRFAAIIHDWLYYVGDRPKLACDAILRDGMLHTPTKVSAWQRQAIYAAVVVGGWPIWNRYRRS